jgi:hypothetical protein
MGGIDQLIKEYSSEATQFVIPTKAGIQRILEKILFRVKPD